VWNNIKITIKSKTGIAKQLKFDKVIAASVLMYGSENQALNISERIETETRALFEVCPWIYVYIYRPCTQYDNT
jgi:hypothetical protein